MFEVALYVGLMTAHIGDSTYLNEDNQVVAVEYKDYFAATMVNSYFSRSYLIGKKFEQTRNYEWNYSAGVLTALVTGYKGSCIYGYCRWDAEEKPPEPDNYPLPVIGVYMELSNVNLMFFGNAVNLSYKFQF